MQIVMVWKTAWTLMVEVVFGWIRIWSFIERKRPFESHLNFKIDISVWHAPSATK